MTYSSQGERATMRWGVPTFGRALDEHAEFLRASRRHRGLTGMTQVDPDDNGLAASPDYRAVHCGRPSALNSYLGGLHPLPLCQRDSGPAGPATNLTDSHRLSDSTQANRRLAVAR